MVSHWKTFATSGMRPNNWITIETAFKNIPEERC